MNAKHSYINSMIQTAIILAGGLGTRLRSAVADLPKCMAPVYGIPFISFVISNLRRQGITTFIFSLGYKSEVVTAYLDDTHKNIQKKYVIETTPLGTGGAIKEACKVADGKNVIVVNGDTLFMAGLEALSNFHTNQPCATCTIALKQMVDFDRYGAVELNADQSIKAFKEKEFCASGIINGGVYALTTDSILSGSCPEIFSFEKEFLEKKTGGKSLFGIISDAYFIDIGIPEDYQLFQNNYAATITNKNEDAGLNVTTFLNALNK